MSSLEIGLIALLIFFGSAMLAMVVGHLLPRHHLSDQTRTAVSVAMAVVGTMSALVVSLLISNASSSYSARNADIMRLGANVIQLDHLLRRYGPQADGARTALRQYLTVKLNDLFGPQEGRTSKTDEAGTPAKLDPVQDLILALQPSNNQQHWLVSQALQLSAELDQTRWLAAEESMSSFPLPFLGGLVIWMALLFASFGLFAPRNVITVVMLFVAAFVVSTAIKMLLDMDSPFTGYPRMSGVPIRVSAEPIRHALEVISRPGAPD
jgi:hypothetical protein